MEKVSSALGNQKAHFHRVKAKLLLSEPPQAIMIHRGMKQGVHHHSGQGGLNVGFPQGCYGELLD